MGVWAVVEVLETEPGFSHSAPSLAQGSSLPTCNFLGQVLSSMGWGEV